MKAQIEFIDWLCDAYAMEKAMEQTLERQRDDQSLPPLYREQAALHYVETQRHAAAVAACLKMLGTDVSTLKTLLAEGWNLLRNSTAGYSRSETMKQLLAAYASEHFEIACYTTLRTGAERLGLANFAATCGQIIEEERRMAEWLEDNLPKIAQAHLDYVEMNQSMVEKVQRLVNDTLS